MNTQADVPRRASRLLLLGGICVPTVVVLVALFSGPSELTEATEGLHHRPPFLNLCRRAVHLTVTMVPVLTVAPAAFIFPLLQARSDATIVHALER